MSKDKVYLVPVNRLAPEFLLRIADQSVTADGPVCCGCEKPFGRAGRIAGAMVALNPGSWEKAVAIAFLCRECGSRHTEVCRRLNVDPIESSPDDQEFWTHAVFVEMAIAQACSLDPADCVPGYGQRRGLLSRPTGEFIFIAPEQMSLEFRVRIAGVRVPGKTCFACNGPCEGLAQLGVIVGRYDPDGGMTMAMACIPCAQGPRTILVEAFSRKTHVRLSPSEVALGEPTR